MYKLVTAFDYNIVPQQFFAMTRGDIELLLAIRERQIREQEADQHLRR